MLWVAGHGNAHGKNYALLRISCTGKVPFPQEGCFEKLTSTENGDFTKLWPILPWGSFFQVRDGMAQYYAHTQADELIIDARIHDPAARC